MQVILIRQSAVQHRRSCSLSLHDIEVLSVVVTEIFPVIMLNLCTITVVECMLRQYDSSSSKLHQCFNTSVDNIVAHIIDKLHQSHIKHKDKYIDSFYNNSSDKAIKKDKAFDKLIKYQSMLLRFHEMQCIRVEFSRCFNRHQVSNDIEWLELKNDAKGNDRIICLLNSFDIHMHVVPTISNLESRFLWFEESISTSSRQPIHYLGFASMNGQWSQPVVGSHLHSYISANDQTISQRMNKIVESVCLNFSCHLYLY